MSPYPLPLRDHIRSFAPALDPVLICTFGEARLEEANAFRYIWPIDPK